MIYELITLPSMKTNDKYIELDDSRHGSRAIYCLDNPIQREVWYCSPDEANDGTPQCDYLLYIKSINSVRFVELKGIDANTKDKCCKTTWAHGFHQLEATYDKYFDLLDAEDIPLFFLCTSIPKARIAAKYTKYPRYRSLCEKAKGRVRVLFSDEVDSVEETSLQCTDNSEK